MDLVVRGGGLAYGRSLRTLVMGIVSILTTLTLLLNIQLYVSVIEQLPIREIVPDAEHPWYIPQV